MALFIDYHFSIHTDLLSFSLVEGNRSSFISQSEPGKVVVVCPPNTDFYNIETQLWLRKVMCEALRKQAKAYLPARIHYLSQEYQLPFDKVAVNSAHTRWGSCSSRKSIHLSLYLMLVPSHLIDYVLLHELCHTKEMNHGERFWALLDSCTNGRARALRKELNHYLEEL